MNASVSVEDATVRIEALRKEYHIGGQHVVALAGVTASFAKGSFWAIMGPSGSGKSTMLNLLGCLDRPTSGRYAIEGQDVSALNDDELSEIRLRRLGFVFQSFNLIPQLTVQQNIELPLYYLGWEPARSWIRFRQSMARRSRPLRRSRRTSTTKLRDEHTRPF